MTDAFWQRPKRNVAQSDYVWYDHAPLGSSTLTKIMQRISLQAGKFIVNFILLFDYFFSSLELSLYLPV